MSIAGMKRRLALGTAALSVLAVTAVGLVAAAPGSAFAATGGCGTGSSHGNVRTCVSLSDKSVSVSAQVKSSGRVLNSCLRRNGKKVACTGYRYIAAGHGTGLNWIPGGQVPDGTYCAVTWRKNPNGAVTKLGSECVGTGTITIG